MLAWALLADSIPLYPLYALLFADTGLSEAQISALLAIWSATGIVAEVPSGAVADRWSRRGCLAVAGVSAAAGFAVWLALPGFAGFALGFVLWGLGGSLLSGAQEALLYDGLAAVDAQEHYARVQGWVVATGYAAQLPASLAATGLLLLGGYDLVAWASIVVALGSSVLALRLPEAPRTPDPDDDDRDEPGYVETLRIGVREASGHRAVRAVVLAAAVLGGFDAIEEYFPLLVSGWGLPTAAVPIATTAVFLAGAAGAASAGAAARLPPLGVAVVFGGGLALFAVAGALAQPYGIALVALFYGGYRVVLVVVDARLQERITGPSRATVTSVAGFGVELVGIAVFALWALGGLPVVVAVFVVAALALPRWLR